MLYRNRWWISLAVFAVLIKIFSLYPFAVEHYYSQGIYPYIAAGLRILFGWIPFSIGDILYGATGIWLIMQIIYMIKRIRHHQAGKNYFGRVAKRFIAAALLVYVAFNVLWGLNYNRLGIDYQLHLNTSDYNNEDLLAVSKLLVNKVNMFQPASLKQRDSLKHKQYLFHHALNAYYILIQDTVMKTALHINSYHSVKPSLYSYLGNYLGFTGYYNPFTGEAQVNTTVPLFVRPFTTCHEIGHQLGYAKESEANFAGYLAASASRDSSFLYSVYFDMFAYSSRYLYYADSNALKTLRRELSPGVVKDIRDLKKFLNTYSSPLGTAIDRLYSQYLVANEQPSGQMSYNEVVAMLIAYYKRNGKI